MVTFESTVYLEVLLGDAHIWVDAFDFGDDFESRFYLNILVLINRLDELQQIVGKALIILILLKTQLPQINTKVLPHLTNRLENILLHLNDRNELIFIYFFLVFFHIKILCHFL